MRVALVNKYRLFHRYCQFEVLTKGLDLDIARRKIAIKIEAGFTYCPHTGVIEQLSQGTCCIFHPVAGMVWMNASGTNQMFRILSTKPNRFITVLDTSAGYYHLPDASVTGAFDHRVEVLHQAIVGQIDADIDVLCQCLIPVPRSSNIMQILNRTTMKNKITPMEVLSSISLAPRNPKRKLLTI